MKKVEVVNEYLKKIKRELYAIDNETSLSVLEELRSHINEKANDLAKQRKINKPNEDIYQEVIGAFGEPGDVVIEYLKVLPKNFTRGIKIFFLMQSLIGLFSIILGIEQIFYSFDIFSQDILSNTDFLGMVSAGIIFLFIGCALISVIYIQIKKPKLIIQYGAFSSIVSLTICFGIILILIDILLWRYTTLNYSMDEYYSAVSPILISLVIAHVIGLQLLERFQRRFVLEEINNKDYRIHAKKSKIVMTGVSLVILTLVGMLFFSLIGYEWLLENEEEIDEERAFNSEYIGGVYNAKIELNYNYIEGYWHDEYRINYTINQKKYSGSFFIEHRKAYDWIIDNVESNASFLCWWDYGHSIKGYTGRNVIITDPSKSIINTIYDPSHIKSWEDDEKVKAVASALVADNSTQTKNIMYQYNADYILTGNRDPSFISYAIYQAAGLNSNDYLKISSNGILEPTELGRQTLIYRLWSEDNIEDFELVFSDINSKIYKITN